MAIDSKNLLVWVKAMSRGSALPLDASEVYESYAEAQNYAASAIAYAGQTIKAKLEDGKYHTYTLQPSDSGYVLEEAGVDQTQLKQYVQVVDALPESGQAEGVLYICGTDGSIWTGNEWKTVFSDLSSDLDKKAPIANPVFTGTVKVGTEEVAVKSYVDGLLANMVSDVPGVLTSGTTTAGGIDKDNPHDYKAGQTYRVADADTYFGHECEAGDLVIILEDYSGDAAGGESTVAMVIQANVDGAVTSSADAATVGEIVVFDAVTGKVIKGSGVQLASLNDAISKAHTHTMTEAELLAAAKAEAEGLVAGKADKATTLAGYGITDAYTKTEVDAKLQPITENINSKVSAAEVDAKIEERVGDIPEDTTIKSYIDTAVGSGGTASAEAIAEAKQQAIDTSKAYTDSKLAVTIF